MSALTAAVIGLGMGANHARAYAGLAQTDLIALCDPDEDSLNALGDELGIQLRFTDHRDLLEVGGLDVCSVCSPDHCHASQTVDLLAAGVHVLCEKPMAPSLQECRSMVQAAREAGRSLMVGQSYRFQGRFRAIKDLVDRGELGELYLVQSEQWNNLQGVGGAGNWRNVPGVRHPFVGGCHAMDLCRWVAGEVVEVSAYGNHLAFPEQPADDCVIANVRFAGGCLGRVLVSSGCRRPYSASPDVSGTRGTIEGFGISRGRDDPFRPLELPAETDSIAAELAGFVRSVLEGTPAPVTAEDGFGTMAACFAAVESAPTGRPVVPQGL